MGVAAVGMFVMFFVARWTGQVGTWLKEPTPAAKAAAVKAPAEIKDVHGRPLAAGHTTAAVDPAPTQPQVR